MNYNIVRDWNKLQGMTSATDAHVQILRDVNYRYITIENSATVPVRFAITTYYAGPIPASQYILQPGQIFDTAINSIGEQLQFIHLLDFRTKMPLGQPAPLRTDANQFVIRAGLNKWWIDNFHRPSYRGQ